MIRRGLVVVSLAVLLGCGGGGGGGGGTLVRVAGRVLNVETGGAVNPAPTVQIGSASVVTTPADGSFSLDAASGATSALVNSGTTFPVFTFATAPLTEGADLGDLWVGPETVTVRGTVRDSTTGEGVIGATVAFAGRSITTSAAGEFSLASVAYSSLNPSGFWGIEGTATAEGYVLNSFAAADLLPVSGIVTVDDILLTPLSDPNPPSFPYNLFGRVSPSAQAAGTVAVLSKAGNPVRSYTVGSDGRYYFWVPAGSYSIALTKGSLSASVPSVTLPTAARVVQRDVTLN